MVGDGAAVREGKRWGLQLVERREAHEDVKGRLLVGEDLAVAATQDSIRGPSLLGLPVVDLEDMHARDRAYNRVLGGAAERVELDGQDLHKAEQIGLADEDAREHVAAPWQKAAARVLEVLFDVPGGVAHEVDEGRGDEDLGLGARLGVVDLELDEGHVGVGGLEADKGVFDALGGLGHELSLLNLAVDAQVQRGAAAVEDLGVVGLPVDGAAALGFSFGLGLALLAPGLDLELAGFDLAGELILVDI
mmetsp:Transcript_16131/g.45672  ORF Transcript_16131/g.45672 Transcript_16131/m.45672 type:complete len:248 (-) Transcript_16131:439-1182(-)